MRIELCRIERVQFNSTLERKVKTRALKGIFLVRKWINNTESVFSLFGSDSLSRSVHCAPDENDGPSEQTKKNF